MANPTWPATLPDGPLVRGYSETFPELELRTAMDKGPAKVRKEISANVTPVTYNFSLTKAQVIILRDFHKTTVGKRFDWTEPLSGSTVEFRFVGAPKVSGKSRLKFIVSVQLEIMP